MQKNGVFFAIPDHILKLSMNVHLSKISPISDFVSLSGGNFKFLSLPRFNLQGQVGEAAHQPKKDVYSVWEIPTEDVTERVKKLMIGLRSEFGGPEFEPHVTVVGAISLTEGEARDKLQKACEGLKAYNATVEKVTSLVNGTFFYECVFLLLHPTTEVMETGAHCWSHFGYKRPTPYMPHLSILYAYLTEEEKQKAQERANVLDESIKNLKFKITHIALYKTGTEDKTPKSLKKVSEVSYKITNYHVLNCDVYHN